MRANGLAAQNLACGKSRNESIDEEFHEWIHDYAGQEELDEIVLRGRERRLPLELHGAISRLERLSVREQ